MSLIALEIHGEDAQVATDRADALALTASRVLPRRGPVGFELGEGNVVGFHGDELSLRFLHGLAVKRGYTDDELELVED